MMMGNNNSIQKKSNGSSSTRNKRELQIDLLQTAPVQQFKEKAQPLAQDFNAYVSTVIEAREITQSYEQGLEKNSHLLAKATKKLHKEQGLIECYENAHQEVQNIIGKLESILIGNVQDFDASAYEGLKSQIKNLLYLKGPEESEAGIDDCNSGISQIAKRPRLNGLSFDNSVDIQQMSDILRLANAESVKAYDRYKKALNDSESLRETLHHSSMKMDEIREKLQMKQKEKKEALQNSAVISQKKVLDDINIALENILGESDLSDCPSVDGRVR